MNNETNETDETANAWFVYMLRCADQSLYTGIAKQLDKRLAEHNFDNIKGAKYTRARRPVELVYSEAHDSRSTACKRESAIKKLSRSEKLLLIASTSTQA